MDKTYECEMATSFSGCSFHRSVGRYQAPYFDLNTLGLSGSCTEREGRREEGRREEGGGSREMKRCRIDSGDMPTGVIVVLPLRESQSEYAL